MSEPRDGTLAEAEIDKLLSNPDALNDPAAVESLAERGIVGSNSAPAEDADGAEEEQVEDAPAGDGAGTDDAGDAPGTAGDEPPAPEEEDPAAKAVRLEAENKVYREMLQSGALTGKAAKEETPPPPPEKPPHVKDWERLVAVDKQTTRAHYEKLTADGHTFEADQFLAAWQNAPGQLAQYREQESFRASLVSERDAEAKQKAAVELKALNKAHPDWEKYADVMEDLAKRDAAAQRAGFQSAYSTMEELYQEAVRKKGGTATAALSPADAKRKAALGRGPSSRRGGTAASGGGTKPNPEQELIRSILRDDVRI